MPLWPSRSRASGGGPSIAAGGGCPPTAEGQTTAMERAPSGVSFAPEEITVRRDAAPSKAHVGVRMTIRFPELAYEGFDAAKRRALLDAVLREAVPPGFTLSEAVRGRTRANAALPLSLTDRPPARRCGRSSRGGATRRRTASSPTCA